MTDGQRSLSNKVPFIPFGYGTLKNDLRACDHVRIGITIRLYVSTYRGIKKWQINSPVKQDRDKNDAFAQELFD